MHGTKLQHNNKDGKWGRRLLDSIKHVNINELQELVETIARVNSKNQ